MAFQAMTPVAALLAKAGVRHVLADAPLPAELSLCPDAFPSREGPSVTGPGCGPRQERAPGQAPRQPAQPAPGGRSWQARPARPVSQSRPAPRPEQGEERPRRQEAPRPAAPQPPLAGSAAAPRLRREEWPEAWRALMERTRPGTLCWTYWELGLDLCGKADPGRRQWLNGMIRALALPQGTHTFWPPALPGENGLVPDAAVFWSGLRETRARTLVVMGARAARAIGLAEPLEPLRIRTQYGVRILVCWDLPFIIADGQRHRNTLTFLRTTLSTFIRR